MQQASMSLLGGARGIPNENIDLYPFYYGNTLCSGILANFPAYCSFSSFLCSRASSFYFIAQMFSGQQGIGELSYKYSKSSVCPLLGSTCPLHSSWQQISSSFFSIIYSERCFRVKLKISLNCTSFFNIDSKEVRDQRLPPLSTKASSLLSFPRSIKQQMPQSFFGLMYFPSVFQVSSSRILFMAYTK